MLDQIMLEFFYLSCILLMSGRKNGDPVKMNVMVNLPLEPTGFLVL